MDVSKLFNVLVMGGAALVATSCADEDTGPDGEGAASAQQLGQGGAATSGQSSTGQTTSSGDGGATTSGNTGGGQTTTTGAGGDVSGSGGGGGGEAPLICSDPADPADACGCACCWAEGCLNTEPCCSGFCSAGNDGAGCCGS